MKIVDFLPGARAERDHAAVADIRRLLIERLADPERQLAHAIVFVHPPPCRNPIPRWIVRDYATHAERAECRVVEANRAFQIVSTEVDVAQHQVLSVRALRSCSPFVLSVRALRSCAQLRAQGRSTRRTGAETVAASAGSSSLRRR